jgi:hypothetical protein
MRVALPWRTTLEEPRQDRSTRDELGEAHPRLVFARTGIGAAFRGCCCRRCGGRRRAQYPGSMLRTSAEPVLPVSQTATTPIAFTNEN